MRSTASKAGLLTECQYWAQESVEWVESTSPAADRGTRFHAAISDYVSTGQIALEAHASDIRELLVSAIAWVDHFGRENLSAEVAIAWSPMADTAEVLGHDLARDYTSGAGRFCGSADLVAISRATRTGYIGDWATGDGSGKGPQLRALAMMLARAENLDSVTVEALEVTAAGVRHVCCETLDSFDLAAVAGELADAIGAIPKAEPRTGAHCGEMYCPARATCPAVTAIVAEVIPPEALVRHKWGITISSAEHAAWLYDQAKAVESAARLVKDAVKAYVPATGLPLEDGTTLIEGSRQMPRFDKDRAISLARSLGATDEQIEACTYVATESSGLKRTGGAVKPRKRKAA